MRNIKVLGIDLAKNVFQIHGTDLKGKCLLRKRLSRAKFVEFIAKLNPKVTPSIFVNNLKTVTSRLIRKEFAEHLKKVYWKESVFWSRSYCILTYGGAPLSVLKQYIEQQNAPL